MGIDSRSEFTLSAKSAGAAAFVETHFQSGRYAQTRDSCISSGYAFEAGHGGTTVFALPH